MFMKPYAFFSTGRCTRLFLLCAVLFGVLCLPLAAQETQRSAPRVAVLDFQVESKNPDYEFLGKGFAEFIAVELSGIKGVTIIDRERRNAIIEEQKFGLSGLADETQTVELGKILSANYLLSGSIFDMFGQLEVTVKLIDAEQGSAAVSAQAGGEPKEYKKIVAELAGKVVSALDLAEAAAPVKVAAAAKPLDNTEADMVLSSFSKAVEAVDKKDVQAAKENLQAARKIDRENKAVTYYLNKLFTASPKFNVELISYAPSYNPASLGFIDEDRIYLTSVNNLLHPNYENPNLGHSGESYNWELSDGLYYKLVLFSGSVGYYFPLGERFGLGAEFAFSRVESRSTDYTYNLLSGSNTAFRRVISKALPLGGRLSLGIKLSDTVGIGLSGYGYYSNTELPYWSHTEHKSLPSPNVNGAVTLGLYLQFLQGNLIVDTHATATFLQEVYLDYTIKDYVAYRTAPSPVAVETSVIGKLIGGRLNLSLKNISEIYISFGTDDRRGIATRIIPAVEWWPVTFFSVRAGGEYDLLALRSVSPTGGFGALGGLTFRIGPVDIDANYTYMQRVMRFYPGLIGPDHVLLIQASWNGAFIKER
jgi:TolB-like protein